MVCRLQNLEIVITNVVRPSKIERKKKNNKDLVAIFSFNIIDPVTNIVLMACNKFSLRGSPGNWKVFSRFITVYDEYAPEDIPDDQAVKPLFLTSFYPKQANKEIDTTQLRTSFINDLGDAVIDKLQYHQEMRRQFHSMQKLNEGRQTIREDKKITS